MPFLTPSDINIPNQCIITRHCQPPLECGYYLDRFELEFQNYGLTSLKNKTQMAGNLILAMFLHYSPSVYSTKSPFTQFCFACHPKTS